MQSLFIANASKQEFILTYILPESVRSTMHKISSGRQIKLDLSGVDVEAIIKQQEPYGLMEVNKVKKGFGGICYRLGKPINVEAIEAGITQSDQEAYDRSQEIRNGTVAAQDHIFATSAQEMGVKQVGGLEFEVVEEKLNAADTSAKFEQKIEAIHEGAAPKGSRRTRK